ncbi:MAG: hypothetical protein JJ979_25920 [Roseibium sp.]|nr:hypothetical protein [Roseibium sp.]
MKGVVAFLIKCAVCFVGMAGLLIGALGLSLGLTKVLGISISGELSAILLIVNAYIWIDLTKAIKGDNN